MGISINRARFGGACKMLILLSLDGRGLLIRREMA
jgi:hypothetical protein